MSPFSSRNMTKWSGPSTKRPCSPSTSTSRMTVLRAGLLDEAVADRAAGLREHEPRLGGIAVDDRGEAVRPDEDRVGLVAEVEQLEAEAPLGLRAGDPLAEVDALGGEVRQRLDPLHGRAADRKSSRNALRAPGEKASTPARATTRTANASASGRRQAARAGRRSKSRSKRGVAGYAISPPSSWSRRSSSFIPASSSCSRRRPSAREVLDLTVPRRSESTSPVSSSPRSSR